MHTLQAMDQYLVDSKVIERSYPLPIIYLAILKSEQGNLAAACSILGQLRERVSGPWKLRIDEVSVRLSCRETVSGELTG